MTRKDELAKFKKMWTWLSGYPAYDREYYMKNVVKLGKAWVNGCPLSNNSEEKKCDGCKELWLSDIGTLCTDPDAPLYKWKNTARSFPDDRSFYASQTAVLAMRFLKRQMAGNNTIIRRHLG